ncbi:MAG: DUF559 domain-containing protein [Oscillospiraceae bacterium]|nr:DUF559 domain-containing protein [Oscillospiraceae bacterium]
MRKNATPEEEKLWYDFLCRVRPRFHRQQIIGDFIADFYCPKAKLVIEIDGIQHIYDDVTVKRDIKKDEYLKSNGFEVLRFDNHEINRKMDWVEENILLILERRLSEFAVECPVVLVGDE